MKRVKIDRKTIGEDCSTFIIAEIGMNHDGSIGLAKCLIDAASEAGADAVKFQTHIPEEETLSDAPVPPYFKDEPRFEYFKRTAFDKSQLIKLKDYAESKDLVFLSSPFSIGAIDLLESIGLSAYKIPSGEVTNIPYLEYIAKTDKPIIISSGMSTLSELDDAIAIIKNYNKNVFLMQCTSAYPCPYKEIGLNLIKQFKERFNLPVGLSDHTTTIYTAIVAVALGACIIEKHFTLSKRMYGPDSKFSLEPDEFRQLVEGIRAVEVALSNPVDKNDIRKFEVMKNTFQKSIVSLADISKGTIIDRNMISTKKPGSGLQPKYFEKIIGKKVKRNIKKDSLIFRNDIEC